MDALLSQVTLDVSREFYGAVVSITSGLVDPIVARVDDAMVEVIVEADEIGRTAALAVAVGRGRTRSNILEVGRDRSAERLRQLSEEVSRIASTLARLSTGPSDNRPASPAAPDDRSASFIGRHNSTNHSRPPSARALSFAEELFADPAWDMMLDLLQAEIAAIARACLQLVHRRGGPGDDRVAVVEGIGDAGPVYPPSRSTRWPPRLRRACSRREPCASELFAEVGQAR